MQVLLQAYSVSGVGNSGAGREGEGGVRHEACSCRTSIHCMIGEISLVF